MPTISRVEGLLGAYGGQIGSLRLMARGVDPGIVSAVRTERVDVGGRLPSSSPWWRRAAS